MISKNPDITEISIGLILLSEIRINDVVKIISREGEQ
jgi:hypothetical protein